METNESNPIHLPIAISVELVQTINRAHLKMGEHIKDAASDKSTAFEQVMTAQYASALSDARRSVERVLRLQERIMEQALANRPCEELDALKDQLGL